MTWHVKSLVSLLPAAMLLGLQIQIAEAAEDIVGLKIGITPVEARLALQQINLTFKISESKEREWNAVVLTAEAPTEKFVLKFTESAPRAWFIGRAVAFPQGKRPLQADLNKDIVAKFGAPSVASGNYFAWAWAANNQKESHTTGACSPGPIQNGSWGVMGSPLFYQRSLSRACSKFIEVQSGNAFGDNPNLVGGLSVTITDFALAFSDPNHPANVVAARERQQLQDASKNKPKL